MNIEAIERRGMDEQEEKMAERKSVVIEGPYAYQEQPA